MQHQHLWYVTIEYDRTFVAKLLLQLILRHKRKIPGDICVFIKRESIMYKHFKKSKRETWIDVSQLVRCIKIFWFCIIKWLQFHMSPSIIIIIVVNRVLVLAPVQPWSMAVNNSHGWTDHEFVMRLDMPNIIGTPVCCALHNKTTCLGILY